jgi:hypothetical protein
MSTKVQVTNRNMVCVSMTGELLATGNCLQNIIFSVLLVVWIPTNPPCHFLVLVLQQYERDNENYLQLLNAIQFIFAFC